MAYDFATLVLMIVLIVFTALSSYGQVCSVCLCSSLHLFDIIIPPTKRPGVHATAFSVVHVGEQGCEDAKESHLHFLVAPV